MGPGASSSIRQKEAEGPTETTTLLHPHQNNDDDYDYRDALLGPSQHSQRLEAGSAVTDSTESRRYFIQNGGIGGPLTRPPFQQAVKAKKLMQRLGIDR